MTNQAFFLHTLSGEFDRFHGVVAALPADRLDYRHDPKSRTASDLVGHLIGHFQDLVELIDDGVINHRMQVPFADLNEAIGLLDGSARAVASRMERMTDEAWAQPAEFRVGARSLMTAPRQALAWMLLLDGIHHRGQLSTLIRPMGGKVPAIYGPSADTAMAG